MKWYVVDSSWLYPQYPRESSDPAKTKLRDVNWTFKSEHALTFPTRESAEEAAAWLQLLNPRAFGPLCVRSEQELIERILTKEQSAQ